MRSSEAAKEHAALWGSRLAPFFTSLRWCVHPFRWFIRRPVDETRSVVTDLDQTVMFVDHFRLFVDHFRLLIDPVGVSRDPSVMDVRPVGFVLDPTCCDRWTSITDLWNRRSIFESSVDVFDHRRRDVSTSRWFLCHSVIVEPPVVTDGRR